MSLLSFLSWEKWLARLLHPVYVGIRKGLFEFQRRRSLQRSVGWPEMDAEVYRIVWDSSLPREQILYSYSTEQGYFSGAAWRWFEHTNAREVGVGDKIVI